MLTLKRKLHSLLLIFTLAGPALAPLTATANLCTRIFTGVYDANGTVKREHQFRPLEGKNLSGSVLLPDSPVHDQGACNFCYVHGPAARLERSARDVFGASVPLSTEYLIYQELQLSVLPKLIDEQVFTANGGLARVIEWVAAKRGIIPAAAWKPKVDFTVPGNQAKLIDGLNRILADYQADVEQLGQSGAPPSKARDRFDQAVRDLRRAIDDQFGVPPSEFEFRGKYYTAESFAARIGVHQPKLIEAIVPVEPRPVFEGFKPAHQNQGQEQKTRMQAWFGGVYDGLPLNEPEGQHPWKRAQRTEQVVVSDQWPLERMHAEILASLRRGTPVYVAINTVQGYYHEDAGLYSIEYSGGLRPEPFVRNGSHLELITGVYRSSRGKVWGYRLQNSWGNRRAKRGYDFLGVDYFDRFGAYIDLLKPETRH